MYSVLLAEFGGKSEPKKIDLNPITEFYYPVTPCLVELQSLLSLCIIKLERNLRRLYQGGETMREKNQIEIPKEKIEAFCIKHHILKLSLFGSVLREDFDPESDVDVLVEFEPGQTVGLLRLAGMEIELSGILKRKVDLRTPAELSRYFRQQVLDSAEVQYAQG
jgi:predicted nucleotidyltransferase